VRTTKKLLLLTVVAAAVPSTASAATVSVDGTAIDFVAAPGEKNVVNVTRPAADRLRVFDGTGGLVAGDGCVSLDNFTAECSGPGLADAVMDLGDRGDVGAGGPGADRISGGPGSDALEDGDDGGSPSHDVLDGGDGHDVADYSARRSSVIFDLAAGTGLDDESDDLAGIESVFGGSRNDALRGDAGGNRLRGYRGRDGLHGRGGDDVLRGGRGADRMRCGSGTDRAFANTRGDSVVPDCEWVAFDPLEFSYRMRPYPRNLRPGSVTFRVGCATTLSGGGKTACRGNVVVRRSASKTVLGRGKVAKARGRRGVRVALTPAGRRLAARPGGVRASVTVTLSSIFVDARVGYTIRLKSHK
jgi:hypothetical protein